MKASKKVAHKIRKQILEFTNQLKSNPKSGQIEFYLEKTHLNYRYVVSGNYKIIYRFGNDEIKIVDIFDTRQSPEKMMDEKRKTK